MNVSLIRSISAPGIRPRSIQNPSWSYSALRFASVAVDIRWPPWIRVDSVSVHHGVVRGPAGAAAGGVAPQHHPAVPVERFGVVLGDFLGGHRHVMQDERPAE